MNCECAQRDDSFPRLAAETARFSKGQPRSFVISAAAHRLAFTRSADGHSSRLDLYVVEDLAGQPIERLVLKASDCVDETEVLSAAERARRERLRESGAGITAFSADKLLSRVAFALSGRLWTCEVATGVASAIGDYEAVVDPRLNASGDAVAFTDGADFVVYSLAEDRELARLAAETETVTYGLADFIAAEELGRYRGHWWSPDGASVLVERNDEARVAVRWLADPTFPDAEPRPHRYAQAGTDNSEMSLVHLDIASGVQRVVEWNRAEFEYLGAVEWDDAGARISLLTRDQRRMATFTLAADGLTLLCETQDANWVDADLGLPTLSDGKLLQVADGGDHRTVSLDGTALDFAGRIVSGLLHADAERTVVSAYNEPWQLQVLCRNAEGQVQEWSDADGYAAAVVSGKYAVVVQHRADRPLPEVRVISEGKVVHVIANHAETPSPRPRPQFLSLGARKLPAAVFFPEGHQRGSHKLPVVVHIYGGPHHAEVKQASLPHATKQWLANQGFAVVTIDNRGTPGKGPAWERAVAGDLAAPVIADQVEGLQELFALFPDDLDATRVGITGWSFGGFLSALAVLERPDIYKAAWAGAPVTDWRLYDTGYTERYLGHPDTSPENYERSSLAHRVARLEGALCLIHGLSDDNVLAAHSLQLSGALLAAGKPHSFLPLAGVSHMTPQVDVASNLLLLQRDFFAKELG